MRYTTWLFDQADAGGPTAKFSKVAWDDVNNGCASARFSTQEWIDHFTIKHPDKADTLIEMLFNSYVEYTREIKR